MANEKVWTSKQREAAATILEQEDRLYWSAETYLRREHPSRNGMDELMIVLLDKQCEISEAVALLTLTADQLEDDLPTGFAATIDEWLKRNTGGNYGK